MSFLSTIEQHWTIITAIIGFVVSVAVSYLYLQWRQKEIVVEVERIKEINTGHQKDITDVKDRLGNIEASVTYMKEDISFIKDFLVKIMDKK